ncbi:MAG TPA: hypothetical protein VJQ81_10465, partial [Reyranella sp.]|nr:hypothetical protein [Reyranella sp.]
MSATGVARSPESTTTRQEGLTAGVLIGPATIFVAVSIFAPLAILFRYSLNDFDKATKTMIAAVTPA